MAARVAFLDKMSAAYSSNFLLVVLNPPAASKLFFEASVSESFSGQKQSSNESRLNCLHDLLLDVFDFVFCQDSGCESDASYSSHCNHLLGCCSGFSAESQFDDALLVGR